jgi:mannose-1-phosphate guanylyltransferase
MFAVVLVGGFGTRLRPLTYHVPKPLLPVGHRSLLEDLMGRLARGGVTDAVLALGFKPEPFLQAFPDAKCAGVQLHYAIEDRPLDTAGAIGFAARQVGLHERNETFFVANGDVITELDLAALRAFHESRRSSGALATIHLTPVDDPSQFGVVETDAQARVLGFVEKPPPGTTTSRYVNAGTYVCEPETLALMPGDEPLSIERVVFPQLAGRGALFAYPTDDYWLDAGRPDTYRRANADLLNGRRGTPIDPVHPTARVSPSARIVNTIVGAGSVIADDAVVTDSVIMPAARIGRGAHVTGSVVLDEVADRADVVDALVAAVPDTA